MMRAIGAYAVILAGFCAVSLACFYVLVGLSYIIAQ